MNKNASYYTSFFKFQRLKIQYTIKTILITDLLILLSFTQVAEKKHIERFLTKRAKNAV